MNLPTRLRPAAMMGRSIAAAKRGHDVLEAMRPRDRLALTAAVLALVIGLDLLVVLPMRDKRIAIELAERASVSDINLARVGREAEQLAREIDLQSRLAKVTQALAGFGAAGKRDDSLRFLLSRTLQGLPVEVLSLRALGVEEMEVAPAPALADAGASAPPEPASSATGSPPPAAPAQTMLYRHRYELRVGGGLAALLSALEALEQNTRPLRIERVRLRADPSGALEASVVLMTLGPERTWLAL